MNCNIIDTAIEPIRVPVRFGQFNILMCDEPCARMGSSPILADGPRQRLRNGSPHSSTGEDPPLRTSWFVFDPRSRGGGVSLLIRLRVANSTLLLKRGRLSAR